MKDNLKKDVIFDYDAKQITRLMLEGEEYENLKKIMMINILNDEFFPFEDHISKTVTVMDHHREYVVIDAMEWCFIELPKFRRSHLNMDEKVNQWLAIIDDVDEELIEMANEKNQLLQKVEAEKNKSFEIAKEMFENGEKIEKIEKYTKLKKEEIEKLKNRK